MRFHTRSPGGLRAERGGQRYGHRQQWREHGGKDLGEHLAQVDLKHREKCGGHYDWKHCAAVVNGRAGDAVHSERGAVARKLGKGGHHHDSAEQRPQHRRAAELLGVRVSQVDGHEVEPSVVDHAEKRVEVVRLANKAQHGGANQRLRGLEHAADEKHGDQLDHGAREVV